jgi:hypothetical protein
MSKQIKQIKQITAKPNRKVTHKLTPTIGVPTGYKGCIIVPVADGFDVVDRVTGRWMHVPTQRVAKWNATVWTRLSDEFNDNEPLPLTMLPIVQYETPVRVIVGVSK